MEHTPNTEQEQEIEVQSYVKFDGYYLIDKEDYHLIYKRLINNKHYLSNKDMFSSEDFKIWRRKVIAEFYADFYITSEESIYDAEQLRKLNLLRLEQEIKKDEKSKYFYCEELEKAKKWELGHFITYRQSDKKKQPKKYYKETTLFKGVVTRVYTKKGVSTGVFDIRIGEETFRKIGYKSLTCRQCEDYSDVTIPDELEEMTTRDLLKELEWSRKPWYGYSDRYYYHTTYDYRAIKAVLATREHIPTKADRRKGRGKR
jgi:hypothetical protein